MRVLAIDPGTTKSGWCLLEDGAPTNWGWEDNREIASCLIGIGYPQADALVIEDIGNYGMAVGADTFETLKWMGKFEQGFEHFYWDQFLRSGDTGYEPTLPKATFIMRPTIKTHLCGVASAKDGNVRQALIDRFGGDAVAVGGKKCQVCKGKGWVGRGRPKCPDCGLNTGVFDGTGYETPPGVLHGISGHVWSALACGVTYLDQQP